MIVSTKGRYALRVMVDLAEHRAEGYVPLKEIADRQEISEKYLENILKVLVQEQYLVGLRGKGGGYQLSRAPETYTVGSILRLTEGSLAPVACLESPKNTCPRMSHCRTLPMWKKLDDMIQGFFDGITLADLMNTDAQGGDYVI
jgi:Rrf2 family iron-sulfur cluster assembly transcriptional regulator